MITMRKGKCRPILRDRLRDNAKNVLVIMNQRIREEDSGLSLMTGNTGKLFLVCKPAANQQRTNLHPFNPYRKEQLVVTCGTISQ